MTKTALIAGISGQDGAYLASLLLNKGYRIVGTSRDAQMDRFSNLVRLGIRNEVELESLVPTDFRSVLQVLSKVKPDEVYNLAGQSSVSLSFNQPVETIDSITIGTLNLLEAIRFIGKDIKFYNAGSSECFGDTSNDRANEDTPFHPRSPYAVAKSAAHWVVSNYRDAYGLYACSGILFNHESPLRPDRFVTKKIISTVKKILEKKVDKLYLGDLSIERDWGWASEYVEAMWLMLQQEVCQDFVISTGESNSLETFVKIAFDCVELNWRDHVITDSNLFRPSEIKKSCGDSSKAMKLLHWTPHYRMRDVIRMMFESDNL